MSADEKTHSLVKPVHLDVTAVVHDVVSLIEGADHAALTVGGEHEPVAATDGIAFLLESSQHQTNEGPSFDAFHTGTVTRLCCKDPDRWPTFRTTCEWQQIRSVASFPVRATSDQRVIAVLTVYSSDFHAFGANEIRIGRKHADVVAHQLDGEAMG